MDVGLKVCIYALMQRHTLYKFTSQVLMQHNYNTEYAVMTRHAK